MSRRHGPRHGWRRIFALPALLALATLIGLVAGLLGDGGHDMIAAIALATPLAAIAIGRLLSALRRDH